MDPTFREKGSREQADLAKKISKVLFSELKPYVVNGKISALIGYVGESYFCSPIEDINPKLYDLECLSAMVGSDLEHAALVSVKGYTIWRLCYIVGTGDYSVPSPSEIDFSSIEQKYQAPPLSLRRTVSFMHSQKKLPLLGKIVLGQFQPDEQELEWWKGFYDWTAKEKPF